MVGASPINLKLRSGMSWKNMRVVVDFAYGLLRPEARLPRKAEQHKTRSYADSEDTMNPL